MAYAITNALTFNGQTGDSYLLTWVNQLLAFTRLPHGAEGSKISDTDSSTLKVLAPQVRE